MWFDRSQVKALDGGNEWCGSAKPEYNFRVWRFSSKFVGDGGAALLLESNELQKGGPNLLRILKTE
jgi:hypothetical protein